MRRHSLRRARVTGSLDLLQVPCRVAIGPRPARGVSATIPDWLRPHGRFSAPRGERRTIAAPCMDCRFPEFAAGATPHRPQTAFRPMGCFDGLLAAVHLNGSFTKVASTALPHPRKTVSRPIRRWRRPVSGKHLNGRFPDGAADTMLHLRQTDLRAIERNALLGASAAGQDRNSRSARPSQPICLFGSGLCMLPQPKSSRNSLVS